MNRRVRNKSGQLTVAVVCLVLGFLLSMNYRVQRRITANPSFSRDAEAAARLADAEKARDAAQAELAKLRQRVDEIARTQTAYEALAKELGDAQIRAGFTAMKGPGVVVMLDDSKTPYKPGENPNDLIIHDSDILRVINELVAGGAEALSINGQRYTSRTEIRCIGPTISVNQVRTAPPVYIRAIGDPDVMEAAINLRGGVAQQLAGYGIQVNVRKEREITVPPYGGSLEFRWGQAVKE